MNIVSRFRVLVGVIVFLVASVSIANLVAEFVRPAALSISGLASPPPPGQTAAAKLASAIMPFRSDLRADYALTLAADALSADQPAQHAALEAVKNSLQIGPHDSQMWLILALLQARSRAAVSGGAESLKMSYLTGQNRAGLMPTRLGGVTSGNSLSDPDLADLARGDVRAILTQLPDQRPSLVSTYARASQAGKQFLEQSVAAIDPKFVGVLRK